MIAAVEGLLASDTEPGIGQGAGNDAEEGAEGVRFEVNGGKTEKEVDDVERGDGGEANGQDKDQGFAGNGLIEASKGFVFAEVPLAPVAEEVARCPESTDGSQGGTD